MEQQTQNAFVNKNFKFAILVVLLSTLFLQFLKSLSNIYYIVLIFVVLTILLIFIIEGKVFLKKNITKILYYAFYLFLIISCLYSLNFINTPLSENSKFDFTSYLIAISRMMMMPSLVFIFAILFSSNNDFKKCINIYLLFFVLGAVSMIIQQFIGEIKLLGPPGPARYAGMIPYGSTLGNITIYGTAIGIAILVTVMSKELGVFLKSIILFLLVVGIFLNMQKAGVINLFLCAAILLYLIQLKKYILFLLLLFVLISIVLIILPDLFLNIASLITNTFGFEIIENTKSTGLYKPISERFIDRLTGRTWIIGPQSTQEFLIGWGLLGGGGSFGISFDFSGSGNYFTLGAPHNQYLGIFLISGAIGLLLFLVLIFSLQLDLYHKYRYHKDEMAKIFFFANILFIINLIVAEGSLFHPYTSFIFYISIYYVLFNKSSKYENC